MLRFAAMLLALLAASEASAVTPDDLERLWAICDLPQVDAGGDAPKADVISRIDFLDRGDGVIVLKMLGQGGGDALYCELDTRVTTFRDNATTIIPAP